MPGWDGTYVGWDGTYAGWDGTYAGWDGTYADWDGRPWQPEEGRVPAPPVAWFWDGNWHLIAQGTRLPRAAPRGWYWQLSGWYRSYDDHGYRWRWRGAPRHVLVRSGLPPPDMPPPLDLFGDGGRWQFVVRGMPLPSHPPPDGAQWWWDGWRWQPAQMPPEPRLFPAVRPGQAAIVALLVLVGLMILMSA